MIMLVYVDVVFGPASESSHMESWGRFLTDPCMILR
jgi:hypothetical protein